MKNIKLLAGVFLFLTAFAISSCDNEPIDSDLDPDDLNQTCEVPTNVLASNFINNTAIHVIWSPGDDEATWTLEYGPAGFTPGTGTAIITSDPEYTVTGLNSNNSYSFYVKSNCNSQFSSDWVGPVTVAAVVNPNCPNPTNFTATRTALAPTDVDLAWAAGSAASWVVQYGPSGFPLGTGTTISTSAPTLQVSDISNTSAYDFYVKANCSGTESSNWVGPLIVQSIEVGPCSNPTNVTAVRDVTTTTDVDVSWTAGGAETEWQVQYGVAGFPLGSGITVTAIENTKLISDIPDANSYDFYVRANCSSDTNSNWVGPINITGNVEPDAFFAKVDNVEFVESYISAGTTSGMPQYISVFGVKNSTQNVGVLITPTLIEGTYTITGAPTDEVKGQYRFNSNTYNATSGTVIITSKTPTRIIGTFSFTASYTYTDSNNNVITLTHEITEGSFNVEY